jgi:hypothetical protein
MVATARLKMARAKSKREKSESGRHLGLRLSPEVARLLLALVDDEQKKAGDYAQVSGSSFIIGLIISEAKRRGLVAVAKDEAAPIKRKSVWEHQKEVIEATGGTVRVKQGGGGS